MRCSKVSSVVTLLHVLHMYGTQCTMMVHKRCTEKTVTLTELSDRSVKSACAKSNMAQPYSPDRPVVHIQLVYFYSTNSTIQLVIIVTLHTTIDIDKVNSQHIYSLGV